MKLPKIFADIFLASKLEEAKKIKLAEYTLENGSKISIDEETKAATLLEDAKDPVPIPVDEYLTTDNKRIVVVVEGEVSEIIDLSVAASADTKPTASTQMSSQIAQIAVQLGELKNENTTLKATNTTLLARITALEKEPAANDIVTDVSLSTTKAKPKHFSESLVDKLESMKKKHGDSDFFEDDFMK